MFCVSRHLPCLDSRYSDAVVVVDTTLLADGIMPAGQGFMVRAHQLLQLHHCFDFQVEARKVLHAYLDQVKAATGFSDKVELLDNDNDNEARCCCLSESSMHAEQVLCKTAVC